MTNAAVGGSKTTMNDKVAKPQGWGAGVRTREAVLKRRYPTIDDLRKRAAELRGYL